MRIPSIQTKRFMKREGEWEAEQENSSSIRLFWALNARLREEKFTKNEKAKPPQSVRGQPRELQDAPGLTSPRQLVEPRKDQYRRVFPHLGWCHLPEKVPNNAKGQTSNSTCGESMPGRPWREKVLSHREGDL